MRLVTTRGQHHTGKASRLAKPRQRGVTLIELLVALAVLVISITWAIPSFQQFSARNEVAAEVLKFKTALALARNTAITRRATVTVCPSEDRASCSLDTNDWRLPLTAFLGQGETGDELLGVFGDSDVASISYRNDNRPVRYTPRGSAFGYNGTFVICGWQESGAQVVVSNFGRTRQVPASPTEC